MEEYRRESQTEESSYKQLKNLQFLEMCIKEVMRLYPVTPLIARDIRQPVHLPGTTNTKRNQKKVAARKNLAEPNATVL